MIADLKPAGAGSAVPPTDSLAGGPMACYAAAPQPPITQHQGKPASQGV